MLSEVKIFKYPVYLVGALAIPSVTFYYVVLYYNIILYDLISYCVRSCYIILYFTRLYDAPKLSG